MIETVLLIEDDSATSYIHKRIINKHVAFNSIITFPGAMKALEYLTSLNVDVKQRPQLIFLDLNMPQMNGWEFLEKYKDLNKYILLDTKLIILTTSKDPNDILRSKSTANVDDFITKPLSSEVLDKVVKMHFQSYRYSY